MEKIMDKPKTERICIRLPPDLIKKLNEIDASTNTQSYKMRRAIKEYCAKEIDRVLLENIYKQQKR